jgi:NAD(P)-dependent dehydrogenase (short-subunit alcohol dehydrogenase family)
MTLATLTSFSSHPTPAALVTGAGRGIGKATALQLARMGYHLWLNSRNQKELEETKADIKRIAPHITCHYRVFDLMDTKALCNWIEEARSEMGTISVLINNAAYIEVAPFGSVSEEQLDRSWAVNVKAPFIASQQVFNHMKTQTEGGVIIQMSSLGGILHTDKFPGMSAYVMSKSALTGLTESLATEGKNFHIRVHGIAPGAVQTQMLQYAAPFLRTTTQPDDIAALIGFLCSKQAMQLTGCIIPIASNIET